MLEFTEPANVKGLKYLENMLYMDGHIIYVTTRVIQQQDLNYRLSSSLFKWCYLTGGVLFYLCSRCRQAGR